MTRPMGGCAVAVASLGRSGTTMVVEMLHRGGLEPLLPWPYESWDAEATEARQVVKWIDPHRFPWPVGEVGVVVWVDRDPTEVALSQVKMIATLRPDVTIDTARMPELVASLRSERAKARLSIPMPKVDVRYEDVLADPLRQADLLARRLRPHVGRLDVAAMAGAVIARSPRCAPDMALEMGHAR